MRKILIIIDPQNDFIQGSLRNEAAIARIPNIINFINNFDGEEIFVTQDTHFTEDDTPFAPKAYKNTLEGKKLPIEHCLIDTTGWKIDTKLKTVLDNCGKDVTYLQKITFGEYDLPEFIDRGDDEDMLIQIMGFCTDICVISNALILRAYYPNTHIEVYEDCCAGSTLELHKAALMTMESCQIDICTNQPKSKIEQIANELFGEMRYNTPEENAAINKYLDSISTVVGYIDDIPLGEEITIKTTDFEIPIEIMKEIKN